MKENLFTTVETFAKDFFPSLNRLLCLGDISFKESLERNLVYISRLKRLFLLCVNLDQDAREALKMTRLLQAVNELFGEW